MSIGLFTHKNRTNTLEASINITNKTPFEYIPDTEILNAGGLHTLRFTILSDNGCTYSVASDSILKCFTPNLIDSRHMNVVNFTEVSEIATNKYRHEFTTENGSRFAAIDSIDKEYFSLSTDWTQRELDMIFHHFCIPDWGKERVTAPVGRKRVYMLLGTNHNELMAEKVAWSLCFAQSCCDEISTF